MDPNAAVLAAIRTMPNGGAYSVDHATKEKLISSVRLEPRGLIVQPKVAQPSFCSGATYLVFCGRWSTSREPEGSPSMSRRSMRCS